MAALLPLDQPGRVGMNRVRVRMHPSSPSPSPQAGGMGRAEDGVSLCQGGLPGNPETTTLTCSIWVTREEKMQSWLGASKDMLSCNVGMALLLSPSFPDAGKKSCGLPSLLRLTGEPPARRVTVTS